MNTQTLRQEAIAQLQAEGLYPDEQNIKEYEALLMNFRHEISSIENDYREKSQKLNELNDKIHHINRNISVILSSPGFGVFPSPSVPLNKSLSLDAQSFNVPIETE